MDYLATVFVGEFSNFSTFSVILLVLGRPEGSSFVFQLTLDRP
jgi:hypothetical protein